MKPIMTNELAAPKIVDRSAFQAGLDALRVREKALMREDAAIAAARRRLPMVQVDGATPLALRPDILTTWGPASAECRLLISQNFVSANPLPFAKTPY
jgi:hypothetical protein